MFIHIEGGRRVQRGSVNPFAGKSTRIVRLLLNEPIAVRTAQAVAAGTKTSYVYAHNVLAALEREGYLERESPRAGFALRKPIPLLRAWIAG